MSIRRGCLQCAVLVPLWLTRVVETQAAPVTWIGGNSDWVDRGSTALWDPPDEPDFDDQAIFDTANAVSLGSDNLIAELTLSGGIDLSINGFSLLVDGLVQLTANGTNLIIDGAAAVVDADDVTINSGASVELTDGTLIVNEDEILAAGALTINAGGTLSGHGTVDLADSPIVAGSLLTNNGTLAAFTRGVIIGQTPPPNTLAINGGGLARINLDGATETGVVNVNRTQTLDINLPLGDPFDGDMNLFQNSTIDVSAAWTLSGGTIDADNGASDGIPPIAAGTSYIAGAALTQAGGTIAVLDNDGTLHFDAPFTMSGGSLVNNGLVVFDADATIAAAANFTLPTSTSSITVSAGRTVTINQTNFNPDGIGTAANILTVDAGGALNLHLGALADEGLGGVVRLNGGMLNVTTLDNNWSIDRAVEVGADTGASQITGEALTIANAGTTVGANSTLTIGAPLTIGVGTAFTGAGTLSFNSTSIITAHATIATAAFDWDGAGVGSLHTIQNGVNLTIQSTILDSDGDMDDPLSLGGGNATLTVNGPAFWEMRGVLTANSPNVGIAHIAGASRMVLSSDLTVNGQTVADAVLTLGPSSTVNIAVQFLRLNGGDESGTFNEIAGSTVHGPGMLAATTGRVLQGFGTIHAAVDFDGTATLRADGGNLIVNGGVVDAGRLGANAGSVLNIVNAWNSNVAGFVILDGGELAGGTLTVGNVNGVSGQGLLSARVINNQRITAEAGTLVVETAGNDNDWDGAANTGHLRAVAGGTLDLRDDALFDFVGTVHAEEGGTVLTNGFGLDFNPGSTISLAAGTYQSTNTTDIGGGVLVNPGTESTIEVQPDRFLDFQTGSVTTLNADLRLVSNNAGIEVGATFGGNGAIIIPEGSRLIADAGANINVLLDVQGAFRPAGFDTVGRVDLRDYQQSDTSELFVELAGTGLNQFDRIVVDGDVLLDGVLDVDIDGFIPTPGDTFNVISANSVSGTFAQLRAFGIPGGLSVRVNYTPTTVQVVVVSQPGDFDDGDVDGKDWFVFSQCLTGPNVPGPPPGCSADEFALADIDGDNDVDLTDAALFLGCYSGEDAPADPACAD